MTLGHVMLPASGSRYRSQWLSSRWAINAPQFAFWNVLLFRRIDNFLSTFNLSRRHFPVCWMEKPLIQKKVKLADNFSRNTCHVLSAVADNLERKWVRLPKSTKCLCVTYLLKCPRVFLDLDCSSPFTQYCYGKLGQGLWDYSMTEGMRNW
jgi:hypothetical protein